MQKLFISSFCILLLVFFKLVRASQFTCLESKCSNDQGPAIHFPLHLAHHCVPGIECNQTFERPILLAKFFVKRIDYKRQEIRVHDPYHSNCLLLIKPVKIPNMSLSPFHLSVSDVYNVTLFSCPPVRTYYYMTQVPCLGSTTYGVYGPYSVYGLYSLFRSLQSCTRMYDVLSVPTGTRLGKENPVLRFKWSEPNCTQCEAEGKRCRWKNNGTNSEIECVHVRKPSNRWKFLATGGILGSFLLVLLMIAAYRVYSADRKEKDSRLRIERFLEDYKALKPSRYLYADIKRITDQFKDKLGQGAYGTVFKGRLSSEFLIAVKVLNSPQSPQQ